jgi:hypothetical protein
VDLFVVLEQVVDGFKDLLSAGAREHDGVEDAEGRGFIRPRQDDKVILCRVNIRGAGVGVVDMCNDDVLVKSDKEELTPLGVVPFTDNDGDWNVDLKPI